MNKIITLIFVLLFFQQIIGQQFDRPELSNIYSSVVGPNSEPVIFNDINLNTYELLSTNIQFSEKNNIQKIVFAPLKLINSSGALGFLEETRINIVQKNGITTFGLGFGYDSSSPFGKKADRLFNNISFNSLRPKNAGEADHEYESFKSNFYKKQSRKYAKFYEDLLKNSYKFTLAYNISLFEIIGGDEVDLDMDNIIDNANKVESHNYSVNFTYVFSSETAISISGHISDKFSNPKGDQERVLYIGGSLSIAHEIISLNKNYEDSKDYLTALFKPAILLGASFEYQEAKENKEFAKDGIIRKNVITPFLDFKITPKTQFRVGIPIQNFEGIKDEVSFGPFVQWTLQIANKS
ncbi:hypothetical protein POV27_09420 [Aureisphaera galaxeae]|uniref:hypothetical protein n=1 Tax=Aureisphaera galaxeae TaxID=1538023 RepID=UPI002350775B|nr:hypothetical protein [Aureisphaera galaxeae]MDC8004269.1 hypothetical protein [Aureisphaera galaxeae]